VLSTKAKFIDYRPLAHHKLYLHDHHFDSRFNAFLRCEAKIKTICGREIRSSHNINNIDALFGDSSSSSSTSTSSSCFGSSLPAKMLLSGSHIYIQ